MKFHKWAINKHPKALDTNQFSDVLQNGFFFHATYAVMRSAQRCLVCSWQGMVRPGNSSGMEVPLTCWSSWVHSLLEHTTFAATNNTHMVLCKKNQYLTQAICTLNSFHLVVSGSNKLSDRLTIELRFYVPINTNRSFQRRFPRQSLGLVSKNKT